MSCASCCEAGRNLVPGSSCDCGHSSARVGDEVHIQGVGIPLGIERKVRSPAVGVREADCGPGETGVVKPTREGVAGAGCCKGRR